MQNKDFENIFIKKQKKEEFVKKVEKRQIENSENSKISEILF